jgi:hypothetical protein
MIMETKIHVEGPDGSILKPEPGKQTADNKTVSNDNNDNAAPLKKNPNPRANENLEGKTTDSDSGGVGSEITDGEAS